MNHPLLIISFGELHWLLCVLGRRSFHRHCRMLVSAQYARTLQWMCEPRCRPLSAASRNSQLFILYYNNVHREHFNCFYTVLPLVLWHCWLVVRKSIWPVKTEWWGVGMVICLDRGAYCLHIVQLMPLHPQTPSSLASFNLWLVLPFWYWLTHVVLETHTHNHLTAFSCPWWRPLNGCSSSSNSSFMVYISINGIREPAW